MKHRNNKKSGAAKILAAALLVLVSKGCQFSFKTDPVSPEVIKSQIEKAELGAGDNKENETSLPRGTSGVRVGLGV